MDHIRKHPRKCQHSFAHVDLLQNVSTTKPKVKLHIQGLSKLILTLYNLKEGGRVLVGMIQYHAKYLHTNTHI